MEEKLTKVKDWSYEDRPREKLMLRGTQSMTNAELLAIILGSGMQGISVLDLSKKILADHNHSLLELSKTTVKEFSKKYKGVGDVKAIGIVAALELGKRQQSEVAFEKKSIQSSQQAFDMVQPLISHLQYEEFWIILLNRANKVLHHQKVSTGGQTGTVVDIRQIMRIALEHYATGIILAHNHPSGTPLPSPEDKTITRQIKEAAQILQLTVFDHIIAAGSKYYSFADEGAL